MSVIHLFPPHLSNEQVHSAGGTMSPTMQHRLCGQDPGQSQKTLVWRFCCRKVAQTPSKQGRIAVPSCYLGAYRVQLWNSSRVGMRASPALVAKIYHSCYDGFFHILSEFPMLQLMAFALGLSVHERPTKKSFSAQQRSVKAKKRRLRRVRDAHIHWQCTLKSCLGIDQQNQAACKAKVSLTHVP